MDIFMTSKRLLKIAERHLKMSMDIFNKASGYL